MTSTPRRNNGTMSGTDTLLWTIGRDPLLRTTIIAVLVLDQAPGWEEVQKRVCALTHVQPRFRSRAQPASSLGWGRPTWVEDSGFDLDIHLRRMVAPSPATLRTVLDLAQAMGTTAFDPELPLWEGVVVEGLEGGQAALVVKLHHAVVDGVGGIAVILHLLDRFRSPRPEYGTVDGGSPGDGHSANDGEPEIRGLASTLLARMDRVLPTSRRAVDAALGVVVNPAAQLERTRATVRSVARLLAPARRPLSPLMTGRTLRRRFEILELSFALLHDTAIATGSTLNDVFVAGVLGGLQRYHHENGVNVEYLRVLMPLNVRTSSDAVGGNHFVPARFTLPSVPDPAERLRLVHDIAGSWKHAPGLGLSNVLADVLDLLPASLTTALWGSMLKGDDFVVTNVPGPPFETYLGGAHVESMFAFAPTSGAALNVSLLTPAGRACVGINVDTAAVPDGSILTQCLQEGFDEICSLAHHQDRLVEA
jgi:diacylglycerol O-acyltransferase / wax synthase